MDTDVILSRYREGIRSYVSLSETEWCAFAAFLKIRKLKKNECFAVAGKVCRDLGFIVRGGVRFCSFVDGKEVTGYFCFENSFVTALKSYLVGEPCLYEIKALDETILVTISKEDMHAMLDNPLLSHKIERFGRLISERFNILFEDRLKSFIIKTAEERYLDLLESGKDVINRIPVQYIAQFIGITPVSLSRIRKRIRESPVTGQKTYSEVQ